LSQTEGGILLLCQLLTTVMFHSRGGDASDTFDNHFQSGQPVTLLITYTRTIIVRFMNNAF
jgi:hypothetical protein